MSEAVVTALVAAGAAIGGGALTGWFSLAAAKRQAAAAWAAGERQAAAAWEAGRQQAAAAWDAGQIQATAQLDVARRTLTEQHLASQRAVRRAAYVAFLGRTDSARLALQAWQSAIGTAGETARRREYDTEMAAVGEALNVVRLEGPDAVVTAAERLGDALSATAPAAQHALAQREFLDAARAALTPV
ncbi:hypothetical protein QNN03_06030 [Streptomyces sp. GXMU-J15]|uniref:Secreted protein n=1 Tax=Streptomyces fuscus TaxID=3048495 RepID=A0ABT7ITU3_9ACTN|nr:MULTISPECIES: hypothetical protein [Streptomyces]MDL2075995.1 hypothetical protein [Streptomyces fuscus]SBT90166.1 hypothetical protein GA0115233_10168 [Streptomyces sp. DI166]